jgi:hypothetical protein
VLSHHSRSAHAWTTGCFAYYRYPLERPAKHEPGLGTAVWDPDASDLARKGLGGIPCVRPASRHEKAPGDELESDSAFE